LLVAVDAQVFDGQWVQLVFGRQGMDHTHIRETVDVDPAYDGPFGPMAGQEYLDILDWLLLCLARSVVNAGHPYRRRSIGQLDDVVVLKAGRCAHTSISAHNWFLPRAALTVFVPVQLAAGSAN